MPYPSPVDGGKPMVKSGYFIDEVSADNAYSVCVKYYLPNLYQERNPAPYMA